MFLTLYFLVLSWWMIGARSIHLLDPSATACYTSTRNVTLLLILGPAAWCAMFGSKVFDLAYGTPPVSHLHLVKTHKLEPKVHNPTPGKLVIKVRREGT